PRRDFSRSHDQARGRSFEAKNSERNRAEHSFVRTDDYFPAGRCDAAAVRRVFGSAAEHFVLVSLLVCLIPTTIGGLLSAIGIAGMDRLIQRNVIAMSGRAVEASGDVDVLLLDKTGTITLGNRAAT